MENIASGFNTDYCRTYEKLIGQQRAMRDWAEKWHILNDLNGKHQGLFGKNGYFHNYSDGIRGRVHYKKTKKISRGSNSNDDSLLTVFGVYGIAQLH